MRLSEIEPIEEGWKNTLANVATAGALAFGHSPSINMDTLPNLSIYKVIPQLYKDVSKSNHAKMLHTVAANAGIEGHELISLMSQAAHETGDFKHMTEVGSPDYFKKKYENPRMAKILGNVDSEGNIILGSGEKYKARGPIGLTGKYNYKKAGDALGLPLETKPELVNNPEIGAKVSVWYWKNRVSPKVSDFTDTDKVTKQINPGMAGSKERKEKFYKFKNVPLEFQSKEKARRP